jgi:hypothetical protein
MIPAVMVNQIAAKTGAVVRNFFMMACRVGAVAGGGWSGGKAQRTPGPVVDQRGETVTLLSTSTNLPPVYSRRAARGQLAAARVLLKARGRSI